MSICLESRQKCSLVNGEVTLFSYYRQKRKGHRECKRDEYITKQSIFVEYIMYSSLEEAFEFCLSSFADEHNNLFY